MATFTFPDSGVTIDIERVPFVQIEMIGEALRQSFSNKPAIPTKEITENGDVVDLVELPAEVSPIEEALKKPNLSDKDKALYQADLELVKKYVSAKRKWDDEVNAAHWQVTRLLYVKHLKSPIDTKAVQGVIDENAEFGVDLKQQVRDIYAKHKVKLDEKYIEGWIYLWMICVKSAADSGALNSWMQSGSKEALQATRQALSLF